MKPQVLLILAAAGLLAYYLYAKKAVQKPADESWVGTDSESNLDESEATGSALGSRTSTTSGTSGTSRTSRTSRTNRTGTSSTRSLPVATGFGLPDPVPVVAAFEVAAGSPYTSSAETMHDTIAEVSGIHTPIVSDLAKMV